MPPPIGSVCAVRTPVQRRCATFGVRLASIVGSGILACLAFVGTAASAHPTSTNTFSLVTASGMPVSLGVVGYSWSSGLTPKLSAHGSVSIDAKVAIAGERTALRTGPLKHASLFVAHLLPKGIDVTYTFDSPRIASLTYVTGHFGPVVGIELSYASVST